MQSVPGCTAVKNATRCISTEGCNPAVPEAPCTVYIFLCNVSMHLSRRYEDVHVMFAEYVMHWEINSKITIAASQFTIPAQLVSLMSFISMPVNRGLDLYLLSLWSEYSMRHYE